MEQNQQQELTEHANELRNYFKEREIGSKESKANLIQKCKTDANWVRNFLLFQIGVYFFCVYVFAFGSPTRLVSPYDSDGLACGIDSSVAKFPYIYYPTPVPGYLYRTVCVQECPSVPPPDKSLKKVRKSLKCIPNSEITQCQEKYSADYPQYNILVYDSLPYKNFCLPTDLVTFKKIIDSARQPFIISKIYDITHCTSVIYILVFLVILINLAILQRKKPIPSSLIVYGGIVGYFLSLSAILYLSIQKVLIVLQVENEQNINGKLDESGMLSRIQTRSLTSGSVIAWSVGFGLILLVSLIYLIVKRKSVQKMVNILRETQKQLDKPYLQEIDGNIEEQKSSAWQNSVKLPIIMTFLSIINIIVTFQAILNAFSCSTVSGTQLLPFARYGFSVFTLIFLILFVIEFFWINSIIVGIVKYIYTNNFALYFLLPEERKNTIQPTVIEKMLNYHIGSIIYGQPIINFMISFRSCFQGARKYRGESFVENFFKNKPFNQSCQIFNDIYKQHQSEFEKCNFIGQTYSLLISFTISFFFGGIIYVVLTDPDFGFQVSSPTFASLIAILFCYLITYLFQSSIGSFIDVISFLIILGDEQSVRDEQLQTLKDIMYPAE